MNHEDMQRLLDNTLVMSTKSRIHGSGLEVSNAASLRVIAQCLLNQVRGNERAPALTAALEPIRKASANIGYRFDLTPNAALDGALASWPPHREFTRCGDQEIEITESVLESAYDYFEHFCAAGWMLDLRFNGMPNQRDDGHAHKATIEKKCCWLCGIDWRRCAP